MIEKCVLCLALKNEKSKYLYEDEDIAILPTKTMKGHRKRVMIISKKHISYDRMKSREKTHLSFFIGFCKRYFDEEPTFALCEPTYATIKDHWHLIACDWFGEEDIKQLHYTPHKAISTNVEWKP